MKQFDKALKNYYKNRYKKMKSYYIKEGGENFNFEDFENNLTFIIHSLSNHEYNDSKLRLQNLEHVLKEKKILEDRRQFIENPTSLNEIVYSIQSIISSLISIHLIPREKKVSCLDMIMYESIILFITELRNEIENSELPDINDIILDNIPTLSHFNIELIENCFVSHDKFKEKITKKAKEFALLYLIVKKISYFEINFNKFKCEYDDKRNTVGDKIKLIKEIDQYIKT